MLRKNKIESLTNSEIAFSWKRHMIDPSLLVFTGSLAATLSVNFKEGESALISYTMLQTNVYLVAGQHTCSHSSLRLKSCSGLHVSSASFKGLSEALMMSVV